MDAEIARHDRMTESGSSLLRLIQNESTPLLDLFVREAVQNSLDAAKDGVDNVNVEFITGKFNSLRLNAHLDMITQKLNDRFPDGEYRFLAVRDSQTVGLTGPLHSDEVTDPASFGNLLKLVYEICKPQQKDGAGGSWGLGKTIYFRLGIGLVFYYSRICTDGCYQSRLAACFVEDEKKPDSVIPKTDKIGRGIAWWGKAVGENKTIPVTDEDVISEILDVLGICPYTGEETGTTVIIPYIDEQRLLSDCFAEQITDNNEKAEQKPYWLNSVSEYLTVAVQRWYAPRLLNKYYKGARLTAFINGDRLTVSAMLPLFRILRDFYIMAITDGTVKEDSYVCEHNIITKSETIFLRALFSNGGCVGKLVFAEVSDKQLLMLSPDNNLNPFQQFSNNDYSEKLGNLPIITCVRKPAMIVAYDFKGPWTRDLQRSLPDKYIIGIFVLESGNRIKGCFKSSRNEELSLEEYIRSGEKADHAEWGDQSINGKKYDIVGRIQHNVSRKLANAFNTKTDVPDEKRNIGLSHALAGLLLPPEDFGKKATAVTTVNRDGERGVSRSLSSSYFRIIEGPVHVDGFSIIRYEMFMKKQEATVFLQVIAGSDSYNADLWENEEKGTGKPFPFIIHEWIVDNKKSNLREKDFVETSISVGEGNRVSESDGVIAEVIRSARYGVPCVVHIRVPVSGYFLRGEITFYANDYELMCNFRFKEE